MDKLHVKTDCLSLAFCHVIRDFVDGETINKYLAVELEEDDEKFLSRRNNKAKVSQKTFPFPTRISFRLLGVKSKKNVVITRQTRTVLQFALIYACASNEL